MYTSSLTVLAAMLSMVVALPQADVGTTVASAAQQCGNGQSLACCNTGTDSSQTGGLLGLSDLLGGQCAQVPVNVLGVQVPLSSACGNNEAQCCGDTTQNGLVNLGLDCSPISL